MEELRGHVAAATAETTLGISFGRLGKISLLLSSCSCSEKILFLFLFCPKVQKEHHRGGDDLVL